MSWRPGASIETLRLRAQCLRRIRLFFAAAGVLEVETPVLSPASVPDPHIESLKTCVNGRTAYLQTSPELYMKRLLAAGSGAIYQISRVFRDAEVSRLHSPEFTLVEWYQPGYGQRRLMDEVTRLVLRICGSRQPATRNISYRQLFEQATGINPLAPDWQGLRRCCDARRLQCPVQGGDWPAAMDWLLSAVIRPGMKGMVFVTDYPACQASLARLDPHNPAVARRFELFIDGVEIANGFEELTDAEQQRRRFQLQNRHRQAAGLEPVPPDEAFLAALEAGMPETSGVALGLDRLLMWKLGYKEIRSVISFAHYASHE